MMEKTMLGKTGLEVTRIGFGGIPIQRLAFDEAAAVVARALDMGVGLIDTARVYTDSEEKIGAALKGRARRPVLVTKTYSRDADGARRDVDISLKNLCSDRIHVYLIHNPNSVELLDKCLGPGGALEGLRKAQSEGLIGFIGISGHKPPIIKEALSRGVFDVVELPFSAIEQTSLPVIKAARRKKVGIIIMKPLGGGALSPVPAAIRFVLAHPIDCVVPGMQTLQEVETDLAACGTLSDAERQALLAEAEKWKGRLCRRCEYCLSECPKKINITLTLLFASYSQRYGLKKWARERYAALPVKADECEECGKCEKKCPYELPIREMLKEAHKELTG
jgi:predicted aldo/keto reductase-like oxidoreductase